MFTGWLNRRGRIAEAKAEAEIQNAGKVIDQAGWKDEYIAVIWSIPAILSFLPGFAEYSQQGFDNLRTAPEWYIYGWVGISLAVFGIKPIGKQITKWRNGNGSS